MKSFIMSIVSLALLMTSLLVPAPVMALSNPMVQSQTLLGAKADKVPASTQETDSKLQSTIGAVTGDGGQTGKKGNTQDRAEDGQKVDQMTNELVEESGT
jgi:opacity protein-like surface antigen